MYIPKTSKICIGFSVTLQTTRELTPNIFSFTYK